MGGCLSVSVSCEKVVDSFSQWLCVKASYIHNLEENLRELETAMEELKGRRDDLSTRVDNEEMKGLRRLSEVQVWLTKVEKLELTQIGVPYPDRGNGCKIVFTTRSKEVCGRMRVDAEMEVQCLLPEDALELFKKVVGETTLRSDPSIPELAAEVAKKCHGLPLALTVIGEAMSYRRTIQEWKNAIHELKSNAVKFSDMEDKILPVLMFSYDSLKEENLKSCFLYCPLVRENGLIIKEKLIDYWIGEGMIDASEGIEVAENKGYEIIGSLVRASLLMEVEPDRGRCMRMHDVVREMALWIASDFGKEKDAFIVHAGAWLREMPPNENWKVVRRISLMDNCIEHLAGSPECLELTTFLLNDNVLEDISMEFFKSMPKLVVLDLSTNGSLLEMPDGISKLVSLQYLNLAATGIRDLPMCLLQELKKLIRLELPRLTTIAGISRLQNLKILDLIFPWDDHNTVEELETLKNLEVLYTAFEDRPLPLEKFLSSHRLTSCTRQVVITNMDLESSGLSLPVTMDKLKGFCIDNCRISEIKMGTICSKSKTVTPLHNPRNICFSSLSLVCLRDCECLKELTFLMFAPNLTDLLVYYGKDVEDIINKEKACGGEESGIVPFLNLNRLVLISLPKLKNIYWSPLLLPSLEKVEIRDCPNLKKLPLSSQSGKQGEDGLIIYYNEEEWIESVEWEDEATKTRFLSSCKQG
ncbi:unnamed protein product [Brassica oleracea]